MNSTTGHAGVGEDLAVGVVERAARVVAGRAPRRASCGVQRDVRNRLPDRRCAGRGRCPCARACWFQTGADSFQVSLARWAWYASHSDSRPDAGRDLEDVAVAVVVVGDHVEHVDALDARLGQVVRLAAGQVQLQRALDQALAQVAGAEAVGGELLAGQVDQPDVAAELARPCSAPGRSARRASGRPSPSGCRRRRRRPGAAPLPPYCGS